MLNNEVKKSMLGIQHSLFDINFCLNLLTLYHHSLFMVSMSCSVNNIAAFLR